MVNNHKSTEIDSTAVAQILSLYPEEKLFERPIFKDAFAEDLIDFAKLQSESEKILIPWQLFFLNAKNLKSELDHIEKERADKVSAKLMSKRVGVGNITSKRIIDRLIRLQNYILQTNSLPKNDFCGSLTSKTEKDAVTHIAKYLEINIDRFRAYKNKSNALSYLIEKVEGKYINISQGVLTNKMLPTWQVVDNKIYKSTSGFVIKDDSIPFIFLPSEINPDEVDGRQIFTLVFLLVVIGLNEYDYFLEKDFKSKAVSATGARKRIYRITSEFLLPTDETEKLRGKIVTPQIRDTLASTYKITPTAVVVTLRMRKIITTKEEYEALLPPPYKPVKNADRHVSSPHIETSVRKFCGKYSFEYVNAGIKTNSLSSIQAQYLLFGSVNKKGFKKYRNGLKI